MKKSVCLSQVSNLGSQIYLYGLIQPIQGRNRVKRTKTTRLEMNTILIDIVEAEAHLV